MMQIETKTQTAGGGRRLLPTSIQEMRKEVTPRRHHVSPESQRGSAAPRLKGKTPNPTILCSYFVVKAEINRWNADVLLDVFCFFLIQKGL